MKSLLNPEKEPGAPMVSWLRSSSPIQTPGKVAHISELGGNTMPTLEESTEAMSSSGLAPELTVQRRDITFYDLDQNTVRIEVTVRNTGLVPSRPTTIQLQSAPLGAFVPWQPLIQSSVPALQPGRSCVVSVDAARPYPKPLGDFNNVPPGRVLASLSDSQRPRRLSDLYSAFSHSIRHRENTTEAPQSKVPIQRKPPTLAPSVWDLLQQKQPYWAGNLNVFIGEHSVERHMDRALRIYPQRRNLAMFFVGEPRQTNAFSFSLQGLHSDWEAALYNVGASRRLRLDSSSRPLAEGQWIESQGTLLVMLSICPPANGRSGNLEVHVTRRSCGNSAVVEFTLDPAAQGSGCYKI